MGTVCIPLTRGKVALIDEEDYLLVSAHKWHAVKTGNVWYARKRVYCEEKVFDLLMHRVILDAPSGKWVDHRSGDGLDNRRANLRFATPSENQQNRVNLPPSYSRFRGVGRAESPKFWRARIKLNGHLITIGTFRSEVDAARAYDEKARELFGEFARFNLPERLGEPSPIPVIGRESKSSRFYGVSFCADRGTWRARLKSRGFSASAGYFDDEEEAARAYDAVVRELVGENARLNFPG